MVQALVGIGEDQLVQRVICVDEAASILPPPGQPFDLWHEGVPWASKVRAEPCCCDALPGRHEHRFLEGGEVHAGLHWRLGAQLHFRRDEQGRLHIWGDLDA